MHRYLYALSVMKAFSGGEQAQCKTDHVAQEVNWTGSRAVCTSNFINAITVNQIGRLDACKHENLLT
jgi:hypothetical protein